MRRWPLVAALLLPLPVQAAPIDLPCSIAIPTSLIVTQDQQSLTGEGKPATVTTTQTAQFARDAAGLKLILGPESATSDLTGAARERLDAAFAPGSRRAVTVRLDETGRIAGMEDMEGQWRDYLGRIEQVALALEAKGESSVRTRAVLAALAKADEATRISLLASAAGPLLQYCGQRVEGGPSANGLLAVTVQTDTAEVSETARYRIDAASGLTRSIERRVASKAQPDKPQVDHWRFEPVK